MQMHQLQISSAVADHLDSHRTAGHDWPADAEYAAVYSFSTWPCGFQHAYIKFFKSLADFEQWVASYADWRRLEDNYMAYRVYEWNLGPVFRFDLSHSDGNVPSGTVSLS